MLCVMVPAASAPALSLGFPECCLLPQVGIALIGTTVVHLDSSDGQVIAEEAPNLLFSKNNNRTLPGDAALEISPFPTNAAP